MLRLHRTTLQFVTLITLFATLLAACSPAKQSPVLPVVTTAGSLTIDPLFREFYDMLGGAQILGPAITPLFSYENRKFQYVVAGCLEYNPALPAAERLRLSPLGMDLGIYERPTPAPQQPDANYVDGHTIFPGFTALYHKLGSARYAGKPLTEVHYNPDLHRYEQYFENLGFYWVDTDPPASVGLLAYGSWKCAGQCTIAPPDKARVLIPKIDPQPGDSIFREKAFSLGTDFTGYQITPPYQTPDGKIEVIFENLVMVVDPSQPRDVSLQPAPKVIGTLPQTPVASNGIKGMVFWPVEGDRGYNVPQVFLDYLTQHGGIGISGPPITELELINDRVFQQCFTNLCLNYLLLDKLPVSLRIQPAPIGHAYQELNYRVQAGNNLLDSRLKQAVSIQIRKKFATLTEGQTQEIGVSLEEGTSPLKGLEPVLFVSYPNGTQRSFIFPPTGDSGTSTIQLPPIQAANGTLIPYQVCVYTMTKEMFCVRDDFVIWREQ